MCFGVFLFDFILYGTLWASWIWKTVSFPMFRKFLAITFSNILLLPFSLSPHSRIPVMRILVYMMFSQRSFKLSSFLFFLFSFAVQLQWFLLLSLPAYCSSPLHHLVCCWFLLMYFFISVILLFISVLCSLYFLFVKNLQLLALYVHFSCNFSVIFTVITLNLLSGRFPVSTSFSSSSEILSYSLIWNMFLCCLVLPELLFVFLYVSYFS